MTTSEAASSDAEAAPESAVDWNNRAFVMEEVSQQWSNLVYASPDLKGDHQVVLKALSQDARALQYASEELRSHREIVMTAVSKDGSSLRFATPGARGDREIVMKAVSRVGRALRYATEGPRGDREVVMQAVQHREDAALQWASQETRCLMNISTDALAQGDGPALCYRHVFVEELRGDRAIVMQSVTQNWKTLQYATEEMKADHEIVMKAVSINWGALKYASATLKGDHEIVMCAVAQDRNALLFASDGPRANRNIIMKAVSQDWRSLEFASEELRGDREIVMQAVAQNWKALRMASSEMVGDDVMARAIWTTSGGSATGAIILKVVLLSGRSCHQILEIHTPMSGVLEECARLLGLEKQRVMNNAILFSGTAAVKSLHDLQPGIVNAVNLVMS